MDVRFLSLRGMKKRDAFVATPMLKFFLFISSSDLDIPIRIKFVSFEDFENFVAFVNRFRKVNYFI